MEKIETGEPESTCGTCSYFRAKTSRISGFKYIDGVGECRRRAPRGPLVIGWGHEGESEMAHRAVMTPFPLVPDDDWCGEYDPSDARLQARSREGNGNG